MFFERCDFVIGKKEFEKNKFLLDLINDEQIKKRIKTNLIWFINKANIYKVLFYIFTITTIVVPIISTVLINIPMSEAKIKILSCFMSGITAACTSIIGVLNLKKGWEIYRIQAEKIKKILSRKLYDKLNDQDVLRMIEESIESTDESWSALLNKSD